MHRFIDIIYIYICKEICTNSLYTVDIYTCTFIYTHLQSVPILLRFPPWLYHFSK